MSDSESFPVEDVTPEVLTLALKAQKRLKLTQLDRESRIGIAPMSGGRPSGIVAITPSNQYLAPYGMRWSNGDVSRRPAQLNTS
jgi:hypothetical protein